MKLEGKRISILGAAKSGIAAAKQFVEGGAQVFISDIQTKDKLKAILIAEELIDRVEWEANEHTVKVLEADYVVVSPGVRTELEILNKARVLKIPVLSEIEAAYRLSKGRRIAVTGSNGKTTTTTLISLMCQEAFGQVFLGGNIGVPAMSFATQTTDSSVQVLEISSFQLETISSFNPDIAVITNFFENHLDRYPTYDSYIKAKKLIAKNMGPNQWIILNADQELMQQMSDQFAPKKAWFGNDVGELRPAVTIINDEFVYLDEASNEHPLLPVSVAKIMGRHNMENIMCALMVAKLMDITNEQMQAVISTFKGVEHRLEFVNEIKGARYINDSKGTNCAASIIAMRACKKPLILIAGGRDKGTDLTDWVRSIRQNCKAVILYGEARQRFRTALEGLVPLKIATSFEAAVAMAHELAESKDTVLLSPACSSYDLFPNFEVRGAEFKKLVNQLEKNES